MPDPSRCERCKGPLSATTFLIQTDEVPSVAGPTRFVVCRHCQKSFRVWLARKRKRTRTEGDAGLEDESFEAEGAAPSRSVKTAEPRAAFSVGPAGLGPDQEGVEGRPNAVVIGALVAGLLLVNAVIVAIVLLR